MTIVSSISLIDTQPQADGSKYVIERHTDNNGRIYQVVYLASVGFDTNTRLTTRAQELVESLANEEMEQLING